jgi:hypothetical protein
VAIAACTYHWLKKLVVKEVGIERYHGVTNFVVMLAALNIPVILLRLAMIVLELSIYLI